MRLDEYNVLQRKSCRVHKSIVSFCFQKVLAILLQPVKRALGPLYLNVGIQYNQYQLNNTKIYQIQARHDLQDLDCS